MITGRLAALVALTLAVTSVTPPQGTPPLVIRVLERTTQQPLPNAEVIDLDGGARRFTNDDGEAREATRGLHDVSLALAVHRDPRFDRRMWWRREASTYTNGWKGPDVVQLLQLKSVSYRKATPPTGVRR